MDLPQSGDTVGHGATAREHGEEAGDDDSDMVNEEATVKNSDRNMDDSADENLNFIGYACETQDGISHSHIDDIVTSDSDLDEAVIGDADIDEPVMGGADINDADIDEAIISDADIDENGDIDIGEDGDIDEITSSDIDDVITSIADIDDITCDADVDEDFTSDGDIDEVITLSTVSVDDEVVDTSVSDVDIRRMIISLTQDVDSRESDEEHQVRSSFLLLRPHFALLCDTSIQLLQVLTLVLSVVLYRGWSGVFSLPSIGP